jgi:hypothetical protein
VRLCRGRARAARAGSLCPFMGQALGGARTPRAQAAARCTATPAGPRWALRGPRPGRQRARAGWVEPRARPNLVDRFFFFFEFYF